jgi:hypothetical protein
MMSRLTGSLKIHDVSKDGRMLLTHATWRASLAFARPSAAPPAAAQGAVPAPAATGTAVAQAVLASPPEQPEADLSWLDWSMLNDVSSDGGMVLFSETREGGGAASSVYLRKSDGSSPVRLGEGWGDSLSPDGKWVLAHASRTRLVRIPTGAGEAQPVKTIEAFGDGALWFPDGKHFLIGGARKDGGYALYMQDVDGNDIKAITPEGIWISPFRACAIAPDGKFVAGMNAAKRLTIYPVDGSRATIIAEAEEEEIPIQWSSDASAIYVYRPTDLPARVYRIDINTGARTLWREILPADPSGVYRISPIVISREGSFWAYNTLRSLADLYVAEGLE